VFFENLVFKAGMPHSLAGTSQQGIQESEFSVSYVIMGYRPFQMHPKASPPGPVFLF